MQQRPLERLERLGRLGRLERKLRIQQLCVGLWRQRHARQVAVPGGLAVDHALRLVPALRRMRGSETLPLPQSLALVQQRRLDRLERLGRLGRLERKLRTDCM